MIWITVLKETQRSIPALHAISLPDPQHNSCTGSVLLGVPATLGKHFPAGEENKGWGAMRLTMRELGIIIIIVGLQTFYWSLSIFSSADGGETTAIAAESFPWNFVALTLTPLRSRVGKRGSSSCEQHSRAAALAAAWQQSEAKCLFLCTTERGRGWQGCRYPQS